MDQPTRVLHVLGRLDSGGAESRTMDIYRAIDRSKVQFDFAIHTEDHCFFTNEVEALGGKIYSFPRFNGKNYFQYKRVWNLFFKQNPEYQIIHGHQTNSAFIYLNEAKKNGIPVRIAHSRNSNKETKLKKYIGKLCRFYATHLFAVSRLAGISEFGEKAIKERKVKILPNAIKAEKYSYDLNTRLEIRSELGLKSEYAVCHIGRFHFQKNHLFILEVFKKVLEQNNDSKLILIGDGPLRENVEKKIVELGIENSVLTVGIRTDVEKVLQGMDVFLFPSLFEGFPGAVLEAQAAGLPCIISDTITDEVKLTELVQYVSLDEKPDYWAARLLEAGKSINRRNAYNEIANAGYDIQAVTCWYEEFYLDAVANVGQDMTESIPAPAL